jgi:transcriptional antiterminator RfaH
MDWHLVRTKPLKEQRVHDRLATILPEVFLPMLEARMPRWGRMDWSITPLFPGYLFGRFDMERHYFDVKYLPGVQGFVSVGNDHLAVPIGVIDELKGRCTNGVVRIAEEVYRSGQHLRVVEGPFRGSEAIFERYLSAAERVAILLSALGANGLRVVLRASAVAKCS